MATPTYTLIGSVQLSGDAASITISSIPNTYRDLIIRSEVTAPGSFFDVRYRFNSSSNIYNWQKFRVRNNSTHQTNLSKDQNYYDATDISTGSQYNQAIIEIRDANVSDGSRNKGVISFSNDGIATSSFSAGKVDISGAVTAVTIFTNDGISYPLGAGSIMYLYGIEA